MALVSFFASYIIYPCYFCYSENKVGNKFFFPIDTVACLWLRTYSTVCTSLVADYWHGSLETFGESLENGLAIPNPMKTSCMPCVISATKSVEEQLSSNIWHKIDNAYFRHHHHFITHDGRKRKEIRATSHYTCINDQSYKHKLPVSSVD